MGEFVSVGFCCGWVVGLFWFEFTILCLVLLLIFGFEVGVGLQLCGFGLDGLVVWGGFCGVVGFVRLRVF